MKTHNINLNKECRDVVYLCSLEVQTNDEMTQILYWELFDIHPPAPDRVWDWLNENITDQEIQNAF